MRFKVLYSLYQGEEIEDKGIGEVHDTYRENRVACRVFVGKREGKRSLGQPRSKWDIIKMCIKGTGSGRCGLSYVGSGQGQVVASYENRNKPSATIQCRDFLD